MNLKGDHCLRFPRRLIIAIRVYPLIGRPCGSGKSECFTSDGLSRLVISKYDRFLGNAGNALKHFGSCKACVTQVLTRAWRADTQFDGTKIIQETQVRGAAGTTSWTFLG